MIGFAGGGIGYNWIGGAGWPRFGYEVNNRWQFSNDLTWVKGRHTIKTGVEFRLHDFPYRGWAVGNVAGAFQFNRVGTAGFDADRPDFIRHGSANLGTNAAEPRRGRLRGSG